VLSDQRFAQLSAGLEHTCGVSEEARLWCWGSNTFGQLGAGLGAGAAASAVPVEVALAGGAPVAWAAASAGAYHTCALTTAGAAFCWGANAYGQLGTGAASAEPLPPTAVNGTWAAVSAGEQFTLAIDAASAELYGW
jgi:alpha-tubulin suppressor-like RCC1 family protein